MRKIEEDINPAVLSCVSAVKSNYRSGKQFHVKVKYCWAIQQVDGKYQFYTETHDMIYDSLTESLADLLNKVQSQHAVFVALDRSEADLIFTLEKAEFHL